jgi:hypothetical protein
MTEELLSNKLKKLWRDIDGGSTGRFSEVVEQAVAMEALRDHAPKTLTVDVMMRCQHQQMRDAINDVELALNGLEIDSVIRLLETADDSVMVKVPLGALRQLGRCYPTLNRIINDPAFERKS